MRAAVADDGREVILVRAVNWLGDAVMTTPALAAVRAAFPRSRLLVAANPTVAELFRHHPHVDGILVYDGAGRHRGARGLLAMAREIRRARPRAAILFQNAFGAALLTLLGAVPERMGYATDGRRFLLTRAVPVTEEILALHHVEYYLRLVAALGMPRPPEAVLSLAVTEEEKEAVAGRLAAEGIVPGRLLLGIAPGAAYGAAKRWDPERFAAVADALVEEWGAQAVVIGSAAEKGIADEVAAGMRARAVNLAGRTTVRELLALLSRCAFLVTNDSGPMHAAAALGVPLVAVFGPTDPGKTGPWSRRARVVRAGVECAPCRKRDCDRGRACMLAVTADMVIEEARGLMEEVRRGG